MTVALIIAATLAGLLWGYLICLRLEPRRQDRKLERLWEQHKNLVERLDATDEAHQRTLDLIDRMPERVEQSIARLS